MKYYEGPVYANGILGEDGEPDPKQVALCRAWLERNATHRHTINTRHSSYGLKHAVERDSNSGGRREYVSNGSFICAAIDLGYKCVPCSWCSPNVYFAISFGPRRAREKAERDAAKAAQKARIREARGALKSARGAR